MKLRRYTTEQVLGKPRDAGRMLGLSVGLVTRAPRRTLAVVFTLGIVAILLGSATPNELASSENEFFSQDTQSYRAAQLIIADVGLKDFPNIGVIYPAHGQHSSHVLAAIKRVAVILPILFRSKDRRSVAVVGYTRTRLLPGEAADYLTKHFRSTPGVLVGGSAIIRQQLISQATHDLKKAGVIALPLLLLLTLIVFRSVVAALLPILTGILASSIALFGLGVINSFHPISISSLNLAITIALGLSLDYSLLLVSRYREELARTRDIRHATHQTMLTAGRTVAISSLTVASAFISLLVFPIGSLRSFAIGGILAAMVAGFVSLIVMPAVFVILGERVNAYSFKSLRRTAERAARPAERGFWYRLSNYVIARPAMIASVAFCILLTMSAPALGTRFTGLETIALPVNARLEKFNERLKSEFNYPSLNDIVVATHGSKRTITTILLRYMYKLPDIKVGEVTQVTRDLWIFNINTISPAFSDATRRLVRQIRAIPYKLIVTGSAAEFYDSTLSLQRHIPLSLAILVMATLGFLFLATGSVILPIKALVMNAFSLGAAFGLLVFVFQHGRLEGLLDYRSSGTLPITQPLLLCTATFGILTDYSIFVLRRIKEGWDSGLSNNEAIALGVERTGRIITAAALLFCVAVGVSLASKIVFLKEAGFVISAAVVIDATITRAFLVPSLMTLLGPWNWWRPRWSYMARSNGYLTGPTDAYDEPVHHD